MASKNIIQTQSALEKTKTSTNLFFYLENRDGKINMVLEGLDLFFDKPISDLVIEVSQPKICSLKINIL